MSVATTYAEALYEAAADKDAVDAVAADLAAFRSALEGSEDLARALQNPEIDTRRKRALIAALTEEAHPLVSRFLEVLVDRARIGEVAEIVDAFEDRVDEARGEIEVEAVTAVPLSDDLRAAIVDKVKRGTGRDVKLAERVEPDLLGGLVLRVDGYVVDGSVRARIEALRRTLTGAPVEAAAAEDAGDAREGGATAEPGSA